MTRKLSQFWHWLKWIAKSRAVVLGIRHEFDQHLEQVKRESEKLRMQFDPERIDAIEKALAEMQAAHAEEMKELRERLDMPRRKQASGRPFTELRKLAEIGERIMSQKESKSA